MKRRKSGSGDKAYGGLLYFELGWHKCDPQCMDVDKKRIIMSDLLPEMHSDFRPA